MAIIERIQIPGDLADHVVVRALGVQLDLIERAINEINGVVRRRTIPEKAREGQIYYLEADIDDFDAKEGFWVFLNDEWYRMDLTRAADIPTTGELSNV